MNGSSLRYGFVSANALRFHYAEAGQGPLVLLLHGFPEGSHAWEQQMPMLAAAGFRAVAPDLRGYHPSEQPAGVAQYRLSLLAADVAALICALGQSAALVGHDWGGVIAWYAAMHYPALVRRLVILNAPHPAAYRRELRRFSSQLWRSSYAAFFQLPFIPEAVLRMIPGLRMDRASLSCALNYYRAALRYPQPPCRRITVPTRVLWGMRDRYLVPALAEGLEAWVDDVVVERLALASHWLHHEQPALVGERIIAFLK